jgi:hypothetical protein
MNKTPFQSAQQRALVRAKADLLTNLSDKALNSAEVTEIIQSNFNLIPSSGLYFYNASGYLEIQADLTGDTLKTWEVYFSAPYSSGIKPLINNHIIGGVGGMGLFVQGSGLTLQLDNNETITGNIICDSPTYAVAQIDSVNGFYGLYINGSLSDYIEYENYHPISSTTKIGADLSTLGSGVVGQSAHFISDNQNYAYFNHTSNYSGLVALTVETAVTFFDPVQGDTAPYYIINKLDETTHTGWSIYLDEFYRLVLQVQDGTGATLTTFGNNGEPVDIGTLFHIVATIKFNTSTNQTTINLWTNGANPTGAITDYFVVNWGTSQVTLGANSAGNQQSNCIMNYLNTMAGEATAYDISLMYAHALTGDVENNPMDYMVEGGDYLIGWYKFNGDATTEDLWDSNLLIGNDGSIHTTNISSFWIAGKYNIINITGEATYYEGVIDFVRYYNSILSSSNITTLYNVGSPLLDVVNLPTSPKIIYYFTDVHEGEVCNEVVNTDQYCANIHGIVYLSSGIRTHEFAGELDNRTFHSRAERELVLSYAPVGAIMPYAGATAPAYWIICSGQSLLKTTYNKLYNVVGSVFGGDSLHFTLPDMRGNVPAGASATYAFGTTGGQNSTSSLYVTATGVDKALNGGDTDNRQPTIYLNYIIFTGA